MVVVLFFGGGRWEKEVVRGIVDEANDGAECLLYCATALFNGGKAFCAGWGCFGFERLVVLVVTPCDFWRRSAGENHRPVVICPLIGVVVGGWLL
jgi:hypothetical protein